MTEVGHLVSERSTRTRKRHSRNGWELRGPLPDGIAFVVQFTPDYWKSACELSTMRNSTWSVKGRKTPGPPPDVLIDRCEVECTQPDSEASSVAIAGLGYVGTSALGGAIATFPRGQQVLRRGVGINTCIQSPVWRAWRQRPVSDLSNRERVAAECGLSETSARSTIRCQTSQAPGAADLPH